MNQSLRHQSNLLAMYGLISNSDQVSGNTNTSNQQNSVNHRNFLGSTSNCAVTTHSLATTQAIPQQQPKPDYTSMISTGGAKPTTQLHQMNTSQENTGMTSRDFEEIDRINSDIIHNSHYPANSLHPMSESGNGNRVHMKSNPVGVEMNSRMPYINTSTAMSGPLHQNQAQVALLEALHNMEKDSACDFSAVSSSLVQTFSTFLQQSQQQQQQHAQTDNNNNCQIPLWQQQMTNNTSDHPTNIPTNQQSFSHQQNNALVGHDNYNRMSQVQNQHHIGNSVQQTRPPAHLQDYNHVHTTHNQISQNSHQTRMNESPKTYNNPGNINNQGQGNSLQTIDMHEFKGTNMPSNGANNSMNVRGFQAYMKSGYGSLRHMSHDNDKSHNQVAPQNRVDEPTFTGDMSKEKKLTRTPIPSDAEKTSTSSGSGAETSPNHYGEQLDTLPSHGNNVFELDFLADHSQNKSVNMYNQQRCVNNVVYSRGGETGKDYANRYANIQPYTQNTKNSTLLNMLSNNPELRATTMTTSLNAYPHAKNTLGSIQQGDNIRRFQQSSTADSINKSFPSANINQELQHIGPTSQSTSNKEAINCYGSIKQSGLMPDTNRIGRVMSANLNNNAIVKPAGDQHDGTPSASNTITIESSPFDHSSRIAIDRNKPKKNKRNKINGKSAKLNDGIMNESNNFVPRLNVQVTSRIPKATADPIIKAQTYALVKDHLTNEQIRMKERENHRNAKKSKSIKKFDNENHSMVQSSTMIGVTKPTTFVTPNSSTPGTGVRQWQTVTAVQVPKLPPMLSEQDRIPKRGRPPKKMVQQNLRVSKPKAADQQKVNVVPNKQVENIPQVTSRTGKLVSMYTINDHGCMEEITPKLKENKRSKERSVAFMNYLDEIRTSQKHQFGESCSNPNNEGNPKQQKNRKKSKPRTRVFGKNTAPITLSGFKETMCTFSELAQQYKISNSILSRATENLRKSAAASVARQRLNSTSSEKFDSFDKLISKSSPLPKTNTQSPTSVTTSHAWSEWSANVTAETVNHNLPNTVHPKPELMSPYYNTKPVEVAPRTAALQKEIEKSQDKVHEQYQEKVSNKQHDKTKPKKKSKKNKKKLIVETQSLGRKKKDHKSQQKQHKSSPPETISQRKKQPIESRKEERLSSKHQDIVADQPEDAYDAGDSLSETESNSAAKLSYQTYQSKPTSQPLTATTSISSPQSNLSFKTAVFPTQSPFQDARESLMQSKKIREDAQASEDAAVVSSSLRSKKHKHKRKSKFQRKSKNNLDPKFIAIMDNLMESFNSDLKISEMYSKSSKNTVSVSCNVFSVQKALGSPSDKILWQQSESSTTPVSVPNKSALYSTSTSSKSTTVKYTNGTSSQPSINTSNGNVLISSISSKKSPDKDFLPTTVSTFCTLPFYQKYGYVNIPAMQPEQTNVLKPSLPPDTNEKNTDNNKNAVTESNKESRKRKRGWPLGKKRGGKRVNNSSDHDSDNSPTYKIVETTHEKNKNKVSKHKMSSNTTKSKPSKSKALTNDTRSSVYSSSPTDTSQPSLDQIKKQIQQAIQSSLSAVPNINADEITKAVNAAIQNYMANNPTNKSDKSDDSLKEETKITKAMKSKRSKTKPHSQKAPEEDGETSPKTHTEKHPKKVWAWKHKDAAVEEPTSSSAIISKQKTVKKKLGRPRKHPILATPEIAETAPEKVRKTSKHLEKPYPDDYNCVKLTLAISKQAVNQICNVSSAAKLLSKTKYSFREPGLYDNTAIGRHIKSAIDDVVEYAVSDTGMLGYYSDDEDTLLQRLLDDSIKPNDKVSSTAKKSLESVVEKLKSKQAQSLQNAAAALLQLQQGGPVCNDGKFNTVSGKKTLADIKALKRRAHKLMKTENLTRYSKKGKLKIKSRGRPKKIIKPLLTSASLHGFSDISGKKRGRVSKKNLLPRKASAVERQYTQHTNNIVTSCPQKGDDADLSEIVLPSPLHAGLFIRNSLHDFQLPYDIWWMYRKRKINASQDPSTQFQVITKNVYNCAKPVQDTEDHICECDKVNTATPCGKNCLNRVVYTECSPKTCPNKESCTNQAMQQKQWCKSLQRFKTKDKGWGIQTSEEIFEGSFILEYVGEIVSENEFRRRTVEHYHACRDHYCVNLDNTRVIDGYRMGNEGRFVNHSCEPNCEMQKWLVNGEHRLGLFARRTLSVGEELTYDYNFHAYNVNHQQKCWCKSQKCRGIITGRNRKYSQENDDFSKISSSFASSSSHDVALWMVKPTQQTMASGMQYNSFKPLNASEKQIIQTTSLFLIRNIRQVQKCDNNPTDSVKYHSQHKQLPSLPGNNKSRKTSTTPPVPDLDRATKLKNVLDEIFDAVLNCEDENGNPVTIPIIANNEGQDDDELNKDVNTVKQKIVDNCFDDLDAFGSYFMQTIKNIEKHFGKKSDEGRVLSIMRKTYSSARSMAEVLIADDFGGRRKSIRNAIRECEFDERKNEDFIRCICQIYKDEGVMVQCESCYVWQHCDCMGIKPDKVDKYLCEKCYPRKVPQEVRVIPQPSNAHPGHTYYITLMLNNMLIKQGDCVYLSRMIEHVNAGVASSSMETDNLNIFRIEKLWTDESGSKFAYGHHFLRPHETHHSPSRTFYHNELFVSPLDEIVPLDAIVRSCCVMDLYTYCKGKPKGFEMHDLYVCDFRVDKTARIFTRITKKKHNVCTKPHVFDTYNIKLCPKKDFRPHQIPEHYKKIHRSVDTLDDSSNRTSSFEEDETMPESNLPEEDVLQDNSNSDGNGDGKNKKKDRLNNIAKKLLSRLPRQAVDMSYLLEPGNGKRQRKKTLVSMESISQEQL